MTRSLHTTTCEQGQDLPGLTSNGRICLVFFHRGGIEVVEPGPDRPMIVGRGAQADICLRDPSLSREHAELVYRDGKMLVRDLQSRNGTFLRGKSITGEAQLRSGDELMLGGVVVQLRVTSGSGANVAGIDSQDDFLRRLEEEVVRARTFGRPLALMMLRGAEGELGHVKHWCGSMRAALRPVDRMALYGGRSVLALVPEVTVEEARRTATQLVGEAPVGAELVCGLAAFPEAARTHEALVTAVHRAVREAHQPGQVVVHAQLGVAEIPAALPDVVVRSQAMKQLHALVQRVAPTNAPVLVLGETGAGKEVIATMVHRDSPRRDGTLRTINCSALPPSLTESLLFGHERGAYTGANRRSRGLFEQADGGTVFLDEVGELSANAQAALLRVLETKTLTRVGSSEEIRVDVRVVAATNRDLDAMIREKTFREDLYYRLNTLTLKVPPLRERPEEIAPLAEMFLRRIGMDWDMAVDGIAADALDCMLRYSWPGNVRELRNVIERAVIVGDDRQIQIEHLPDHVQQMARGSGVPPLRAHHAEPSPPETLPPPRTEEVPTDEGEQVLFRQRVKNYESKLISEALQRHGGNRTRAAKELGIPLRTLSGKIKEFEIGS